MIHYIILVVLYNRLPLASETIRSLIYLKNDIAVNSKVIIWDNSLKQLGTEERMQLLNEMSPCEVEYVSNGENCFLSVIYNKIIKTLNINEYLIILDHDSTINIDYFTSLNNAIDDNPHENLFLPIIKSQNKIVSPANFLYIKGSYWKYKKTGIIKSKNITAINSGMAISARYLQTDFPGYDEHLKFYGTDNDFMNKYSKDNETLFVLNVEIEHVLNFYESISIEDKMIRYKWMKEGALINSKSKGFIIHLLNKMYFVLFSIKLAILNKDSRFIK